MYEGEEVYGLSVVSGFDASAVFDPVEGACEAGAGLVDCSVRADEALSPWIAGDDGFSPDVGEAGAEGRGVVSGGGPHRAGPDPLQHRQGPWRIAGRSGRAEHPERAPERVAGEVEFGRQAASGTPQRLILAPPFPVAAG